MDTAERRTMRVTDLGEEADAEQRLVLGDTNVVVPIGDDDSSAHIDVAEEVLDVTLEDDEGIGGVCPICIKTGSTYEVALHCQRTVEDHDLPGDEAALKIDDALSADAEKDSILLADIFHSYMFPLIRRIYKGDILESVNMIVDTMEMMGHTISTDRAMSLVMTVDTFMNLRNGEETTT